MCPLALPSHHHPIQGCHFDQDEKLSKGFGITEARCSFKRYIKGGKNGVVILNPHRKGSTELRSVTRPPQLYVLYFTHI